MLGRRNTGIERSFLKTDTVTMNNRQAAYSTAWTSSSFDKAMGDFYEKIMLVFHRKL